MVVSSIPKHSLTRNKERSPLRVGETCRNKNINASKFHFLIYKLKRLICTKCREQDVLISPGFCRGNSSRIFTIMQPQKSREAQPTGTGHAHQPKHSRKRKMPGNW